MDRKLEIIYNQIPKFKCIPGCTDCCGPVPFSKTEWDQIDDKRVWNVLKCPYANDGCDIYEHRPLMCRLFGTTAILECPHGCRPPFLLRETVARSYLYQVYVEDKGNNF